MHIHNERSFPQAKLDSKINVRFLLNKHGDLYLLHNNSVHIVLLKLRENFKILEGKKDIGESVHENHYSVMQIMTAKITTLRTLYIHVVANSLMFPQILYDIALYARHFLPVNFFFPSITFITYVSSCYKM